jgi:hypothetical protein
VHFPKMVDLKSKSYDFIHLPSQNGDGRNFAPGAARAAL